MRRVIVAGLLLLVLFQPVPNGSDDGRYHTCGYVTDSGVTSHMQEYWARCGHQS